MFSRRRSSRRTLRMLPCRMILRKRSRRSRSRRGKTSGCGAEGAVPERARAGPGRSAGGRNHSGVAGGRAAAAAEVGHAREAQADGGETVQEDGDIDAELRGEAIEEIVTAGC